MNLSFLLLFQHTLDHSFFHHVPNISLCDISTHQHKSTTKNQLSLSKRLREQQKNELYVVVIWNNNSDKIGNLTAFISNERIVAVRQTGGLQIKLTLTYQLSSLKARLFPNEWNGLSVSTLSSFHVFVLINDNSKNEPSFSILHYPELWFRPGLPSISTISINSNSRLVLLFSNNLYTHPSHYNS